MRHLILLLALVMAACSNAPSHELPQTSDKDPTWQLNEGKWTYNDNALITPPVEKSEPHDVGPSSSARPTLVPSL
jgi:hypothetical protein